MTKSKTNFGHAFSTEVLTDSSIPSVPKELFPWLIKDRREAVEGSYRVSIKKDSREEEHDRMGLNYAVKELKRLERDLQEATGDRAAILTIQRDQQRFAVQFWEGKIWLLDKIISQAS